MKNAQNIYFEVLHLNSIWLNVSRYHAWHAGAAQKLYALHHDFGTFRNIWETVFALGELLYGSKIWHGILKNL